MLMAMVPTLTVTSDCLLTGIDPALEQELKSRLTIDNPEYSAAKRYGRWIGKRLKPLLTYYESVPEGLRFPRGFANQAVLLCRDFTGQDPAIIDRRRLLPEVRFSFQGELRPYQDEAVAAAARKSFGVIEAGTGSGKTVMALALIARRRQPTLVSSIPRNCSASGRSGSGTFSTPKPGRWATANSCLPRLPSPSSTVPAVM